MKNTHTKTEREIYEKLFKFAEKTGLVKNGKYIDGIPQGKQEDVDLFYYWEDFLGYPSPEEVNNKLNKKNNEMKEIVFLYKTGHSENEIKKQLELKGFSTKEIKNAFNEFHSSFKTAKEVFNY